VDAAPPTLDLGTFEGLGWRYERRREDVMGLVWVMNAAASYVLISIGVVDLAWATGILPIAPLLAAWIAGWWFLRTVAQLGLGRRRVDVAVMLGFLALAGIHVVGALAHRLG
jgi:hypothetical protein